MKRNFAAVVLALTGFIPAAFAGNDPQPGQAVLESFKKEFANAEQPAWDKQEDYDKVTFLLAGCRAVAYFSADGALAGTVRDLFFNQLPLSVMTAVDKRFPGADIFDVREISNENGTSYRITLEEKNKKKIVRVDGTGRISDVEKL